MMSDARNKPRARIAVDVALDTLRGEGYMVDVSASGRVLSVRKKRGEKPTLLETDKDGLVSERTVKALVDRIRENKKLMAGV